jgi:hypothetical protein
MARAGWLDDGWADVTLRRPLFAGDELTITVERSGSVVAASAPESCSTGPSASAPRRAASSIRRRRSALDPPSCAHLHGGHRPDRRGATTPRRLRVVRRRPPLALDDLGQARSSVPATGSTHGSRPPAWRR